MSAVRLPKNSAIGLIGLGLMGQVLTQRLLSGGFAVAGFDLVPERCAEFATTGGRPARSASEVAELAECVILSLPDHHIVATVLAEITPALRAGQIVIDTTTGAPEEAERRAAELRALGVAYLDAPIAASSEQTRRGEAVILVGGDPEAFAGCEPVWRALGASARHTGPSGSGARMKLVTNLVLGLNRAALAEGLIFAQALGLDGPQTLETLLTGAAYSRVMEAKGPKMLSADFTPQARLSQHLKDVRLMLDAGISLPLTEAHRALLERAESLGCGALDNSAIIRAYES